jgi:hypothetical protein
MCFLEISPAYFGGRDLRRNRQHGHAGPVAVEQTVYQMKVAWPAATCADSELSSQMRFSSGGKSGSFFVAGMNPFDVTAFSEGLRQTIQAVADDAVDAFHSRRMKDFGHYVRDLRCHLMLLGCFEFLGVGGSHSHLQP